MVYGAINTKGEKYYTYMKNCLRPLETDKLNSTG